jgi:wyosine [tRNA(Phe)-imidazoG37] synthetase (radical SAM superfamily)
MTVLRLQDSITYGPVFSRRLGRSLGVNLLPTDRKVCTFDCLYCHYGRTAATGSTAQARFPTAEQVLEAVAEIVHHYPYADYVTFSGNGEPTLHPDFPAIVAGVRSLLDGMQHRLQLALLSNSTTAQRPEVREALALLDAPILKLDAGDAATFAALNRPARGVSLEHIIEGLKGIPGLITQTVLVSGRVSNARGEAFEAWLDALAEIRPASAQIYSTDRPVPDTGVKRVPPVELRRIAGEAEARTGVKVTAYWA